MFLLLPLIFTLAAHELPVDGRHPEAVEVFACDFEAATDINHDDWPDHWRRRRSAGYPTYMPVGIVEESSQTNGRVLEVQMDGGSAALYSPPIPISPLFSYVLETDVRTRKLRHTQAYVTVSFLDENQQPVGAVQQSLRLSATRDWTKLRIGPFSSKDDRAALAVVGLHVAPPEGDWGFDLSGSAAFDNVWLARLPRMTLETNSAHNVYADPREVEITCKVSGIHERDPRMTFELIDLSGRQLATTSGRLDGEVVALKSTRLSDLPEGLSNASPSATTGYRGEMSWRPPIESNGFYRIRVQMLGSTGVMHERTINVALARPLPPPVGGEFGWSLPGGEDPLPLSSLDSLLGQVGINWVKFPVWYDESQHGRAEELTRFTERLESAKVEVVGVLNQPPPQARMLFSEGSDHLPAASIFAERDVWYPPLADVLTRLSMRIRWWQLGADDDTSFMGHPQLAKKIKEIAAQMGRFGQSIHLVLSWRWLHETPRVESPPWDALNLTAHPPMTETETAAYLSARSAPTGRRWMMLQPLSAERYRVDARARDLVLRMMAAKMNGADVAFATDPFAPETGLMTPEGSPGELLLPWRTTAYMISGTKFLGSIQMPAGSRNYIFTRGEQAVMVVWNENETDEVINLGQAEQIEHVDLWGRIAAVPQREHRQVYRVGPLPTFITGISRDMARWRMHFEFVDKRLHGVYGRPQSPSYRVKNPFRQGAGGTMTINTPGIWGQSPPPLRLNLAGGEERTGSFEIILRSNASSGVQPVRVDFDLTVERDYKFSVWREMEVGVGEIVMQFATHLDEQGNLIVEQTMVNNTDQFVNFKCFLFPPGRRRLRQNVLNLSRGSNLKVYKLPVGEELIGQQLWVRAEEIYGSRVLNYRFTAEP